MAVQRGVPVRIGGHDLLLSYPLSSLAAIQRRLGLPDLNAVMARVYALQPEAPPEGEALDAQRWLMSINLDDFNEIVWCGTLRDGGERVYGSPDDLGAEVSLGDMPELLMATAGAIALSAARWQPSPDNPDPPPAAAPTSA